MADVFISYKRDERAAVEEIAARLRALELQVWFDASLSAGESFNDEIDREARDARLILVCWSPTARESKWVKSEAMIGFEHDKLAAIHIAGPDGFSPPTPFNTVHAEDLRAWIAAPSDLHSGWRSLLRRIGKMCGRADLEAFGALDAQASASELRAWIAAHERSPLFMAVDAWLRSREQQDVERVRIEQSARERRAKEEAERLKQEQERGREEAAAREAARQSTEFFEGAFRDHGVQRERAREEQRKREAQEPRRQRFVWAAIVPVVLLGGYFVFMSVQSMFNQSADERRQEAGAASTCDGSPVVSQACSFVVSVLASTEDVWQAQFQQGRVPNYGASAIGYQSPTLVIFTEMASTACGQLSSSAGPFYCPADRQLYIDPGFYQVLGNRLNAPGDFAQAYVIAHEIGHHVQNLIGATQISASGELQNEMSVRIELQAACFAGAWGHTAFATLALDDADLREALNAAHAIGDDTLGNSDEHQLTHGSSAQRMRWFRRGFGSGDARQCDTFAVRDYSQL